MLIDVNIGLGNGLVLSGNKPLSELLLTNIFVYKECNKFCLWCGVKCQ